MEFIDLAAFTIHDVKNRLAILASRADEKGDGETLQAALESAATLSRLLACYRAERHSLTVDINARVPADLLEELAHDIRRQTALTVRIVEPEASTLWFYDEHLVRMVLLTALYNALRYATREIVMTARERAGWLEFSVRDDGPGFPPELLAEPTALRGLSRDGTGMGLHLASHVAALHCNAGQCGYLELGNDGGAVFSLHLPR